ncbi:MAG: DUF4249 family protein [Armatimonadetes bacterium]|nr:DUF4249 family protein [Armatimonadota bacterium]
MTSQSQQQNTMSANSMMLALIALLGGLVLTACEESVAPDDIPYVERMVVYGIIKAGKPADSIRFTRTLPLNTLYSPTDAELTDVAGTIEAGGKTYPLRHIGNGFYNAEGLVPEAGERYMLRAAWKGLSVNANTTIPLPPVLDSVVMVEGEHSQTDIATLELRAYVRPAQGAAYSMAYNLTDTVNDIRYRSLYDYVGDLWNWRDTATSGHVVARTFDNFLVFGSGNIFTGSVTVIAWDEPYYDYYRTYYFGDNDDLFGGGQRTINWNIEGGGIGLFIGQSATEVEWR